MENFTEVIINGGLIILAIAAAYLISKLASFWATKRKQIESDMQQSEAYVGHEWANMLMKRVLNVVDSVVSALNDTYKKDLLDAVEDGKLDKDDATLLRDKAVEIIMKELPETIWGELGDFVGDATETVKTMIENSVSEQKTGSSALQEYIKNNNENPQQ